MPRVRDRRGAAKEEKELEERYRKANEGLDSGEFTSLQKAADAYGLKKSSLAHRRNGRKSRKEAHVHHQLFTPAEESAMVKWILKLDDCGFPPRLDIVWDFLNKMALPRRAKEKEELVAAGRNEEAAMLPLGVGKHFITRFLNRHTILACKFTSRIDRQRAYASNPKIIKDHFRKLGRVIQRHGIKPAGISNFDEKGFVLGYSPKSKVLTRASRRNPRAKQDGSRKFLTAVEAASADGYIFTPFIIAPGTIHRYSWYDTMNQQVSASYVRR